MLQNSRFLKVIGENPALKAGAQLMFLEPNNPAARATIEDQLHELGEHMGFDFLLFSAPNGTPLAAVTRIADLAPVDPAILADTRTGFLANREGPDVFVGGVERHRANLVGATVK